MRCKVIRSQLLRMERLTSFLMLMSHPAAAAVTIVSRSPLCAVLCSSVLPCYSTTVMTTLGTIPFSEESKQLRRAHLDCTVLCIRKVTNFVSQLELVSQFSKQLASHIKPFTANDAEPGYNVTSLNAPRLLIYPTSVK